MSVESERRYIELPGSRTHELPPLLVRTAPAGGPALGDVVDLAAEMVEAEEMIPQAPFDEASARQFEQRKYDLALHLTDQYMRLLTHWNWGDSILEWIRQCEITFDATADLRTLRHPDVWPHASRASFVALLVDKHVPTHGVGVEQAVGMRLTFRQPPPIEVFSNQFLILLNSPVAGTAYQTWAGMNLGAAALLPPERFHFQIHELN
jgi:hypothetical protein